MDRTKASRNRHRNRRPDLDPSPASQLPSAAKLDGSGDPNLSPVPRYDITKNFQLHASPVMDGIKNENGICTFLIIPNVSPDWNALVHKIRKLFWELFFLKEII
jgi:hypothetical protein